MAGGRQTRKRQPRKAVAAPRPCPSQLNSPDAPPTGPPADTAPPCGDGGGAPPAFAVLWVAYPVWVRVLRRGVSALSRAVYRVERRTARFYDQGGNPVCADLALQFPRERL
jgi:hypothetical protein